MSTNFHGAESLPAVFAMALVAAYSSSGEHPLPAGLASGGGGYGTGGPSAGGSAAGDGGAEGGVDCKDGPQKSQTLDELRVGGVPPPALGGTIAAGTYRLSELDSYEPTPDAGTPGDGGQGSSGDGTTGIVARSTIVVTSDTLRFTASRGPKTAALPADTVTTATFTINGTALDTYTTCPTSGVRKTIPFSAVGGGLALLVDSKHRELYTKE